MLPQDASLEERRVSPQIKIDGARHTAIEAVQRAIRPTDPGGIQVHAAFFITGFGTRVGRPY